MLTLKSGQGIGYSRWWSRGVPMDPNSENAFPEGSFSTKLGIYPDYYKTSGNKEAREETAIFLIQHSSERSHFFLFSNTVCVTTLA